MTARPAIVTTTPPRARLAVLFLCGMSIGFAGVAHAQPAHIPCEVASNQRPTDAEKTQIAEYTGEGAAMLNSGDSEQIERAREYLLTPLRCAEASAAFRIEYWRALDPGIRKAIESTNDQAAANALLVTGMVASTGALQTIERSLASSRDPIRAGAAVALQGTLREQALGRVRLTGAVLENTLTRAGEQLAKETSASVVEAMVVALRAGASSEEAVSGPAMRALGDGAAAAFAALRKRTEADVAGWAHAAERTTSAIWRTTFDTQARAVDQSQAKAAARACAQIIAYARDRSGDDAAPMSDEERGALAKAVEAAEAALILINSRVTGEPAAPKGLAQAFAAGPGDFARHAEQWIGPAGRLTKPPYAFDAKALAPTQP